MSKENNYKCGVIKSDKCIIAEKEPDICCNTARQCCIFCLEKQCPIKEKYKEFITKHAGVI